MHLLFPGRIVDIGCCTGALLRELTIDPRLRESDFYGIEVARPLYAECLHRKEQGLFGSENVFFYQRDFASSPIFAENSINTFTTFALTHEIESYSGHATLHRFVELLYRQLALRGRWINVDVVGPRDRQQPIVMKLSRNDGRNEDFERHFDLNERQQFRAYLDGLSTHARFQRFAVDFRHAEGFQLPYNTVQFAGEPHLELSLQDACEFLSKKDYTDNWASEMHETFCYWSFPEWADALQAAGFEVLPLSHDFTNPWIVEHRLRGKVELYRRDATGLKGLDFPVTNMVLAAEKRR